MQILVLTDNFTPRIEYTIGHILNRMLGFDVKFTHSIDDINDFCGPKICYSHSKTNDSIHITPHNLLSQKGIFKQSFALSGWRSLPTFFFTNPNSEIPFDLFSASFYLISRYEEYLPHEPDAHDRYGVEHSLAFHNNFLHLPLVDLWVKELGKIIEAKYSRIKVKKTDFKFIPTIDIDNAYAYKFKGLGRIIGGTINSFINCRFRELAERIAVTLNFSPDPYDNYQKLYGILNHYPQAIWFILGGQLSGFDRNIPIKSRAMQKLLQQINSKFIIGLHPSYRSGLSRERLSEELVELEATLAKKVIASRQHYLRLNVPYTYRLLAKAGITCDYTMGYSNAIGFRASTCKPYAFYDLILEKKLPLRVVPFQIMDRALQQGMGLGASAAIKQSVALAETIKSVGGTFVTVWHNESLSGKGEWKGWENVLQEIVRGVEALNVCNKM